jgi:putative ABC transport system permease protein
MADVLKKAMWVPMAGSALLTLFGVMALALALVGTYGMTAFAISQRRKEIGIRVALGASRQQVGAAVTRWTIVPALIGITCGLGMAVAGGGFVSGLLIGVGPRDPLSVAAVGCILTLAVLAASALPTASALRAGPMDVLRSDQA